VAFHKGMFALADSLGEQVAADPALNR
jgi:hypothetical protein